MDQELNEDKKLDEVSGNGKMTCFQMVEVSLTMNLQPAFDGKYLVVPFDKKGVLALWTIQTLSEKPLLLNGHSWNVTALTFSNEETPKLLCSCAEDRIILWNLQNVTEHLKGEKYYDWHIQFDSPGLIHFACFLDEDKIIALVMDKLVYLYDNDSTPIAKLEGHLAKVTAVAGSKQRPELLISVSEDRTFMVWDMWKLSILHRSNILTGFSGSPLINVACDALQSHFVAGSVDGKIWMFDLSPEKHFRQIAHIDIAKRTAVLLTAEAATERGINKHVVVSAFKGKSKAEADTCFMQDESEPGMAILGFMFVYPPIKSEIVELELPSLLQSEARYRDIMSPAPVLLIGTTSAIVSLNLRTFEIELIANLQKYIYTSKNGNSDVIGLAGTVTFSNTGIEEKVTWCLVESLFKNTIYINKLNIYPAFDETHSSCKSSRTASPVDSLSSDLKSPREQYDEVPTTSDNQNQLSFISKGDLGYGSPLLVTFNDPEQRSPRGNAGSQKAKAVKSSGYGTPPWSVKKNEKIESKSSDSSIKLINKICQEYCVENIKMKLTKKFTVRDSMSAIVSLCYAGDGTALGIATNQNTAHIINKSGKILDLLGHNGVINTIHFNMDGSFLITGSDDKTAKLWQWKTHEVLLNIHCIKKSQSKLRDDVSKASVFAKEIRQAQFYYMDKFVLITSGSSMYLYKYFLETSQLDIKKFRYSGKYKLVIEIPISVQAILYSTAINQFYSDLVMCACSDRSIHIFDMNVQKTVRVIEDVHTKPTYRICQNEGSVFATQHSSACDMFLTTALGDAIKLWDLRSNRYVQRFTGHLNNARYCGINFSPCARFFSCGSEDKAAYVFDLRKGTYLHKLIGHSSVVSDVIFKPDEPILVTGTSDGMLSYYSS